MDLLFAFVAGALTLINPCVLPVLPIVLASAMAGDRRGPLFLCAGMSASFVVLGVGLTALGPALGLRTETVQQAAAVVMVGFGLVMLVPALGARFAVATGGLAARADQGIGRLDQAGPGAMVLGGALLGAVWSPCIGPTLGGAIALAQQGQGLVRATAVMIAFAVGVSAVMLALAYGARSVLPGLRALAVRARPVLGAAFVLVGLALWFRWFQAAEIWLLDHLPIWFQDLSTSF